VHEPDRVVMLKYVECQLSSIIELY
jgi:hypothetical protein